MIAHRRLEQVHTTESGHCVLRNEKHHEGGTAADHDGVDENAERLQEAGLHRMVDIRCSRSTWGRAGTCFVGEEATLHTIHEDSAEAARHRLTQAESLTEDT